MDVKSLKDQARALEQQGRIPDALSLYRQALDQLTSTAEILRELPLFVKVGDLSAKTGDSETAIALYERAGEHYAAHGSAQSIVALCLKVLRVDSKRTEVYFTLARRMVEAGHVEPARAVLVDFAQRTKQQRVLEALQNAAGRPDEEVRAILEHVIDAVERSLRAREQAAAERTAPQAAPPAPPPPPVPSAPPPPPRPRQETPPPPRAVAPPGQPAAPPKPVPPSAPASPPPPPPRAVEPPHEPEAPEAAELQEAEPQPKVEKAVETVGEKGEAAAAPLPRPQPARSAEAVVLGGEPRKEPRRSRSPVIWIGLAAVVVAAAGVGYFVLQGRNGGAGGARLPDVAVQPMDTVGAATGVMLTDTTPMVVDSPGAPASTAALAMAVPSDTVTPVATGVPAGDTAAPPAAAPAEAAPAPAPASVPPPVITFAGPVVQIEGLVVESVTQIAPGTNAGYRVVQLLETGERVTLTVVPRGAGADTVLAGEPNVGELPAGGAMGVVVFGDYVVSARGPMAPDVLAGLLRRLTQVGLPQRDGLNHQATT